MADDPASALADLLEQWRIVPAGETSDGARELGDPATSLPFWSQQARAFDLVREVERALALVEQQRPTTHYRRHLPAIYSAIGGFTVPFRTADGRTRETIDDGAIDALRALADLLHSMDAVLPDKPAVLDGVRAALDSVRELAADETLDRQSRAYLQALTAELAQAVEDVGIFGTALVRRLSIELAGVLMGQALADEAAGKAGRAQKAARIARDLYLVAATAGVTKIVDSGVEGLLNLLPGGS